MTINLDSVTAPPPIIKNGRYWLPGPDGVKRYYTRATTLAKTLDDTYNLTQNAKRQVAVGVAKTPSIAAGVNADYDNKLALDRLCDLAVTAAGGSEARDLGTALHRLIERFDLGEGADPGAWAEHIVCYQSTLNMHRLTVHPEWSETVLVNHTYGVAGRVDRLLIDPENRLVVADLKTGGFRPWQSWTIQFAIYATATHWWNPRTDLLEPVPPIRQDHTLAIHLPAAETPPHCQIHALSVPLGLDGLLMALEVRRMRAMDKLPRLTATTYHHPTILDQMAKQIEETFDPVAFRANIQTRIDQLKAEHVKAARALIARWPDGVPFLKQSKHHTPAQLALIATIIDRVEADHGIAF